MVLPSFASAANWEKTRDSLHQIAQVVGAIGAACADPLPNELHFSLDVSTRALSTREMQFGGELRFEFDTLQLCYVRGGYEVFRLDAPGHSQLSLMRRLLASFDECGYSIQPSMKHISAGQAFETDRELASAFASALDAVFTALARFRAKLNGTMTPLVLWPHHFDLAFICFATAEADEHSAPQIAYGFAPYSPGLEKPYLYAYAWSASTGYLRLPVEAPAQALNGAYTGLYAAYDDLRDRPDFNGVVEKMLLRYHQLAASGLSQA